MLSSDVVFKSSDERGAVSEQSPVDSIQHFGIFFIDIKDTVAKISGISELDNVEAVFELYVFELVGRPEFGIDGLEEVDDSHVILGFGDIGGGNEEGYPVVSAEAVKVGGQEIISINVVLAGGIDISNNVDLISSIDVLLRDALVDQSHESALLVESGVS